MSRRGAPAVEHPSSDVRGHPGPARTVTLGGARGVDAPDSDLLTCLGPSGPRTVFQPILELDSGHLVGHEALVRGPRGTALEPPEALFAAARRTNHLVELDWACRAAALRASLAADMPGSWRLFVNAEPLALNTACPAPLLADWVAAYRNLRVVVEITERRLMHQPGDLIRVVATLRELGWEVALDDTGANDASVALLPLVEPDIIKLDRRLLAAQPTASAERALRAITGYAERSDAVLLAEGIETEEELERARELGASWGQGYLLGRPGPLASPSQAAAWPPELCRPARPAAGWELDPRRSAFQILSGDLPTLIVTPDWLDGRLDGVFLAAAQAPDAAVLLVSLGPGCAAPARFFDTLAELQDLCALVWVEIDEIPASAPALLRMSRLAHGSARAEVTAVFLSPSYACALSAVRRSDGRYELASSQDRTRVAALSRHLLGRIPAIA